MNINDILKKKKGGVPRLQLNKINKQVNAKTYSTKKISTLKDKTS